MSKTNKIAELIPAFVWDCDNCGTENFVRTIVAELSSEEMAELRLSHGVDPLQEGEFLMAPTSVECKHCGHSYRSVHLGAELEEAD